MRGDKQTRRAFMICCGVTTIFIIILLAVLIALFLTVFKPKQPQIQTQSVSPKGIEFQVFPFLQLNVTLGLVVTVKNRNYGSFKNDNSTAFVYYHGELVAEAPIERGMIPARSSRNISTTVEILADKLLTSLYFWADIGTGSLNLTSSLTLHGKASFLKLIKIHATAINTCDISVFLHSGTVDSSCHAKIKI
ncbi:uncharacterized protein LOC131220064 [Magnolia sinica]|uniref:uncharacterized protein LOC131220064 n=1 Tax=Magnolia sinica TaxID=86752 RepID=UPI002657E9C0|nr:uncharacterized protein LOC131220064 [Magnolia sinica]